MCNCVYAVVKGNKQPPINTLTEYHFTPTADVPGRVGSHVLLVSSMGRSGSSFLGELLASPPSSLYYFEPLKLLTKLPGEQVWPGIRGLLTCNITKQFVDAVLGWQNVLNRNHGIEFKRCNKECKRHGGLVKICRSKEIKVIKTIRMRLAWTTPLLNSLQSLRVIHLVRDPRGSLLSISRRWKFQSKSDCDNLYSDLIIGKVLSSLYPNRLVSPRL